LPETLYGNVRLEIRIDPDELVDLRHHLHRPHTQIIIKEEQELLGWKALHPLNELCVVLIRMPFNHHVAKIETDPQYDMSIVRQAEIC